MMNMVRTAVCLIEGDSINDPALPYVAFAGTRLRIDSAYMAPTATGSYRRPIWVNKAFTGSTTTDVKNRITGGELAANAFTHGFFHMGINDADTAVPLATTQANCTAIKAACLAAGMQMLVGGPLCFGERSPTGQNPNDAAIDAIDAAMAVIFAGPNVTYFSPRTGIYAVQEPISNTPLPGAPSNILTHLVPAAGNGLHCNPGGAKFYTLQTTPLISFS